MVGTFIQPNLHVVLVHFPVALITVGALVEALGVLFWRKSALRTAAHWMIVIGILCAIPTMTTGLYALRQTADATAAQGETWAQITSSSAWTDAQWEALHDHVAYAATGSLLLLVGIIIWIGGTDNARRYMYLLGLVVLLAGAGMIASAAHDGGRLVYQFGTGVQMAENGTSGVAAQKLVVPAPTAALPEIEASFSPLELHLLFAGCAIACVAAAVGLSIRLSNVLWENRFAEEKAVAAGYRPAGKMGQSAGNVLAIPVIYPGIFWAIAIVLLALTALLGLWVFGFSSIGSFVSLMRTKQANDEWRPVFHLWYGMSIIALVILLAAMTKLSPRRRFFTGMLYTLLVLAVAGQSWTGILMLFDGHSGSVFRFNRLQANRPVGIIETKPLPRTTQPSAVPVPVLPKTHTLQTPAPATIPVNP